MPEIWIEQSYQDKGKESPAKDQFAVQDLTPGDRSIPRAPPPARPAHDPGDNGDDEQGTPRGAGRVLHPPQAGSQPGEIAGKDESQPFGDGIAPVGPVRREPCHKRPDGKSHQQESPPPAENGQCSGARRCLVPSAGTHDRKRLDGHTQKQILIGIRELKILYLPGSLCGDARWNPMACQPVGQGRRMARRRLGRDQAHTGPQDTIDGDRALAVHAVQRLAQHGVELGQGVCGVEGALQFADIDETHLVPVQQRNRLGDARACVDCIHIGEPPVHHDRAQRRSLLFLMPVPADDRGQPGVDRDTAAPAVQGRVCLYDHGRTNDIILQPANGFGVVRQR